MLVRWLNNDETFEGAQVAYPSTGSFLLELASWARTVSV